MFHCMISATITDHGQVISANMTGETVTVEGAVEWASRTVGVVQVAGGTILSINILNTREQESQT